MTTKADRDNYYIANLIHAMAGAISTNMRVITLRLTDNEIILHFVLEKDSVVDREEIEDAVAAMEAMEAGPIKIRTTIFVSNDPLSELKRPGRTLFLRKETI